jgi:glycosyltransferase involved in cell wall biosynthesis
VVPDLPLEVLAAPWNRSALQAATDQPVHTVRVPNAGVRYLYEQTALPLKVRREQVLYAPVNFSPLLPSRGRTVLALHNPNYFGHGRRAPHNQRWNRKAKIRLSYWSVHRADRVIVISEALLDEVRRDFPGIGAKAVLLQSGAPEWPAESRRPAGFRFEPRQYFLSLANDYPHKNLDLLVAAWVRAVEGIDRPAGLVLVGDVADDRRAHHRSLVPADRADDLVHLGGVGDRAELKWIVANARAMVAPSSLEAHPLTPAEAGAVGCPLILSDIAPHREVAGDRAAYVAVGDRAALATAMADESGDRRDVWSWPVTWDAHAERLVEIFSETARGEGGSGSRSGGEAAA